MSDKEKKGLFGSDTWIRTRGAVSFEEGLMERYQNIFPSSPKQHWNKLERLFPAILIFASEAD
jgi:hypothetical protein